MRLGERTPQKMGGTRVINGGYVSLIPQFSYPAIRRRKSGSTVMAKLRYCERVHTAFPVVFAGEAYVGEGTVLNVSVPGCAVHSRKRVQSGSYLEMRMLVPNITSPLRVGLAKVRWSEGRRFGVEFIQMPGEDQVRLGRLVKKDIPVTLVSRSTSWQESRS